MAEMDALLFIDTNIYLDFYRERRSDLGLQFLEQVETCRDRLILGSQVEMEYKKNRQRVILEANQKFGDPNWNTLTPPTMVAEIQAAKMIRRHQDSIKKQTKKVSLKISKILRNPNSNDLVYKRLSKVFCHNSKYNLDRESKDRKRIRRLAYKRFILGYPPRKKNDTSIGDAINWEWIIECAIKSGKDIVIVSRDSDFGVIFENDSFLNDWLLQEFQQRVGKRRKIKLTGKLSEALKIIHAEVTREMEEEDELWLKSSFDEFKKKLEDEASLQNEI